MGSLEMEYDVIFQVMDSWEALRRIQDYEGVAGAILFEQYVQYFVFHRRPNLFPKLTF